MRKVRDIFSYSVGHGAIGISCDHRCRFFSYNKKTKQRKCLIHNILLNDIFLTKQGYVKSEFFCNNYENFANKESLGAHETGLIEFNNIKNQLEENILYEACQKEYLCMTSFDELEKIEN